MRAQFCGELTHIWEDLDGTETVMRVLGEYVYDRLGRLIETHFAGVDPYGPSVGLKPPAASKPRSPTPALRPDITASASTCRRAYITTKRSITGPRSAFVRAFHRSARPSLSLQTDPIGYADQNNLYAYVGNDPLNMTDPTGMQAYDQSARYQSILSMYDYDTNAMQADQVRGYADGIGIVIGAYGAGAACVAACPTLLGTYITHAPTINTAAVTVAGAIGDPGQELGALQSASRPPRGAAGVWADVNESMSARAAAYQASRGGRDGQAYIVRGVKFDVYRNGTLIDAKGPGYATFVHNGNFRDWFRGADVLEAQARRQVAAAGGRRVVWEFAERDSADATRRLLQDRGIRGVTVRHVPEAD